MEGRRSGAGLMLAGGIVIVIGLAVAIAKRLELPNYWIAVIVGVGLFLIGLVRWGTSGRGS
jgi:hypothetical protein